MWDLMNLKYVVNYKQVLYGQIYQLGCIGVITGEIGVIVGGIGVIAGGMWGGFNMYVKYQ